MIPRNANTIRSLLFTGLAAVVLTMVGCSSGSSTSGIGTNFAGSYSGQIRNQAGRAIGNVRFDLVQRGGGLDDGGTFIATVEGLAISSSRCPSGGSFVGENVGGILRGSAGNMTVQLRQDGTGLTGTWFAATEGTTTTTSSDDPNAPPTTSTSAGCVGNGTIVAF